MAKFEEILKEYISSYVAKTSFLRIGAHTFHFNMIDTSIHDDLNRRNGAQELTDTDYYREICAHTVFKIDDEPIPEEITVAPQTQRSPAKTMLRHDYLLAFFDKYPKAFVTNLGGAALMLLREVSTEIEESVDSEQLTKLFKSIADAVPGIKTATVESDTPPLPDANNPIPGKDKEFSNKHLAEVAARDKKTPKQDGKTSEFVMPQNVNGIPVYGTEEVVDAPSK